MSAALQQRPAEPAPAAGDAARPAAAGTPDPAEGGPREASPPRHVAVIMDGNRRWAEARGLPVALGHRAGADAARRAIEAAGRQGVSWLTLFAFSSENWTRPAEEVTALTGLLRHYLRSEVSALAKEGIRLRVIGERGRFGPETAREIERAEAQTAHCDRLNLTIALSYGGRAEIVAAARAIAEAARAGTLDPAALDEAAFSARLFTAGMPDPDLIIRTSGEQRLSNFLLWQSAYAEFVFPDVLWPDFDAGHMAAAIADYARRERRFGARAG
jgi:undecaprenyl diphosphate synthase